MEGQGDLVQMEKKMEATIHSIFSLGSWMVLGFGFRVRGTGK